MRKLQKCRLCLLYFEPSQSFPHRICPKCTSAVLQIAKHLTLTRPITYNDFGGLLKGPDARAEHNLKELLLDSGYDCHERRYENKWKCDFNDISGIELHHHTHFHRVN